MSFIPRRACLLLLTLGIIFPVPLVAQAGQPFSSPRVPTLNEEQRSGKRLFLENCSLCHLPKKENGKNTARAGPAIGPALNGLFRGEKPIREETVWTFILRGTRKMPGFQYALEPREITNIIAYLKTL